MMRSAKSQGIFCNFPPKFTHYSLTILLSGVLLADAVGAAPTNAQLQIAQQSTTPQDANRVAAEQAFAEGMKLLQQGTAKSLREAVEKFKQALPLWQQVKYNKGEAATLSAIAIAYDSLGDKQQALNYYHQALTLWQEVEEPGWETRILTSIGNIYSLLGDKQKALNYHTQALTLQREKVKDKKQEAVSLTGIANVYYFWGDQEQALNYYNQALGLQQQVDDTAGQALTLNNIASVYDSQGEKQQALNHYNQALTLRRQVGEPGATGTTLSNIGSVYESLGEKEQALNYYNEALLLARQGRHNAQVATTLNNIGSVYKSLGNKQKALNYYSQALPLWGQLADKRGEASTLNNIGMVNLDLGNKPQALKNFQSALSLSRQITDLEVEATTLNNIGLVYSLSGDKDNALLHYNLALSLSRKLDKKDSQANTLANIAVVERDQGNLQQALTQIKAAIEIIEDLRTKVDNPELRASYFASKQDVYKFYIDLLMQLHKKDPTKGYDGLALQASDRSRARSLAELLTTANVDIRKGVDPKLLAEERRLQLLLDAREKQLSELSSQKEPSAELIAQTNKQIANFLKQQKELEAKIRATNSEYAALKYFQPLTLKAIQQQLDKDTLLLQYSLGEERSYLWAVTPNSLDTYELPGREQIEKVAKDLYNKYLINPGMQGVSPEETAQAANALSKQILAPVAHQLGQKRLVIVADEALQYIPFAVLTDLTPQPPSLQGKGEEDKIPSQGRRGVGGEVNYQPLVVNHEIINLPSASTIAILRQQIKGRTPAPKTLAILADPVFSANDDRFTGKSANSANERNVEVEQSALQRSLRNINRNKIGRLENTRTEAQEILKLVPPSDNLQAFDFDANYSWATSKQLSQYRMVHFATHGFLDSADPELSGIVLSLIDKQGKPQKGFLRLNEIFNLNLPAELVVLSACQTGLGKEVKGEGLVGLTRGLMYAGAARVVVSLWSVNDEATSLLMRQFYSQMLQRGLSPAAALRAAQIKMWEQENWRNPYSWAGFTLLGEWR
ncbi:TPR domain protein [Nostoc sp. NIES-4103]|nr:TPR domain protein [Nostoc sp. NIES-4103]